MPDTVKLPGIGPVDKKWVYVGGAFVVGIAGYAYWNSARADNSEIADYTTDPDYVHDGGEDEYENPGGSEPPVEEDFLAEPTTNAQWSQLALEKLTDAGYEFLAVTAALAKYFARQTLSASQAEIIRAAHALIGPPPVGDYPIRTSPTPDPDPKPKPEPKPPVIKPPVKPGPKPVPKPTGRFVTVTRWPLPGSSLWSIAVRYYKDGRKWTRIWNASQNAKLKSLRKDPKKIRPGDKFWVPN